MTNRELKQAFPGCYLITNITQHIMAISPVGGGPFVRVHSEEHAHAICEANGHRIISRDEIRVEEVRRKQEEMGLRLVEGGLA